MPLPRPLARVLAVTAAILAGPAAGAAHAAVSVAPAEAPEGGAVAFRLTTSSPVGEVVQVTTQDGTAKAGEDFTAVSETRTVTPGAGVTVTVATRQDEAAEQDETFTLVARSQPTGEVVQAKGTVRNDDAPQVVAGGVPARTREGDAVNFAVALLAPTTKAVTVELSTADATAVAPGDFTQTSHRITFAPGEQVKSVPITTVQDDVFEGDEALDVRFDRVVDAVAPPAPVPAVIAEDDPPPRLTLEAAPAVAERDAGAPAITGARLRLSAAAAVPVRVLVATSDNDAKAGEDFEPVREEVVLAPGETEKVVLVRIVPDTRIEEDERLLLLAAAVENVEVAGELAFVELEILNDDRDTTAPRVRLSRPVLSGGSLIVRVGCPVSETRCSGRVTFFRDADRRARDRALRREARLGGVPFWVSGGRQRVVRLELSRRQRALLRRARRPSVTAYAIAADVAGNRRAVRATARLRAR